MYRKPTYSGAFQIAHYNLTTSYSSTEIALLFRLNDHFMHKIYKLIRRECHPKGVTEKKCELASLIMVQAREAQIVCPLSRLH